MLKLIQSSNSKNSKNKNSKNSQKKFKQYSVMKSTLEKCQSVKTFRKLIEENKEDHTGRASLRKIDARNQFKIEGKKKTNKEIQMEMLAPLNSYSNMATYRIELQEGFREEMAKDSSGNSIIGKMPQFLIQFEGPERDAAHYVTRVDDNAHNAGLMAGNMKHAKEMFQQKDLCEIASDALNAPYIPHPQVIEDMTLWDAEFEQGILKQKDKQKEKLKFKKQRTIREKKQITKMPTLKNKTNNPTNLKDSQNIEKTPNNQNHQNHPNNPNNANKGRPVGSPRRSKLRKSGFYSSAQKQTQERGSIDRESVLSSEKKEKENKLEMGDKDVKLPKEEKSGRNFQKLPSLTERGSMPRPKVVTFDANPLSVLKKQSKKHKNLSINWHEYAELRKSNLPNIFNTPRIDAPSIQNLKMKKENKGKSMRHKSCSTLMPPISMRYATSSIDLMKSPKLETKRSQPSITKPESPQETKSQKSPKSPKSAKAKKTKAVPFTISLKPSGENYLNYLLVKEQQKMRNNRMSLLKTLDRQRHRSKFKHD